jgi:hypothetical protein
MVAATYSTERSTRGGVVSDLMDLFEKESILTWEVWQEECWSKLEEKRSCYLSFMH